ncbi:MAG: hypothetical protein Q7S56_03530 [Nanoarchaeota archaeon]|nr:hypothetical protein [Nanoarchaeota archaeon]
MTEAIVDLEAHLTDTQDIVWARSGKHVQDWDKMKVGRRVLSECFRVSEDNSNLPTILSVTNFDDERAQVFRYLVKGEEFFRMTGNLDYFEDEKMLHIRNPFRGDLYFLAGQEIASDIGHITLAGLPFDYYLDTSDKRNREPEKIFSEAEKYGAIVLVEAGRVGMLEKIFGKMFNKLVDKQYAEMSAKKVNLIKYGNDIDAVKSDYDFWDDNDHFLSIAVSDSHVPDGKSGPFSSYAIFNNVDLSSGEKLVASLKDGINRSHYHNVRNEKSVLENLRHHSICFFAGAVGLPTGLMKRDH